MAIYSSGAELQPDAGVDPTDRTVEITHRLPLHEAVLAYRVITRRRQRSPTTSPRSFSVLNAGASLSYVRDELQTASVVRVASHTVSPMSRNSPD